MKTLQAYAFFAKPTNPVYIIIAALTCLPCIGYGQPVAKNDGAQAPVTTVYPAAGDTTHSTGNKPVRPDSITTFEQLEMPLEMEVELSRLQPKGILMFRDEFQGMHDGVFGQTLRTLKLWYIDDHFIGYVIDRPVDAGAAARVIKQRINIPVTWLCTPTMVGHTEHSVATITDLRATEAGNKCTGWHLKLPPPIEFHQPEKLLKPKKPKKGQLKDSTAAKDSSAAGFGKAGESSKKARKGKKHQYLPPQSEALPPSDSTGVKPLRDSL